jgi:hypothetical protein
MGGQAFGGLTPVFLPQLLAAATCLGWEEADGLLTERE